MNITGKYLKVWKREENEYGVTLNLGESKKKYNGEGYDNWTWFKCKVKGNATNVQVNENDVIHVNSGIIKQFKTNEGKWLNDIVIFEMEKVDNSNGGNQQSNQRGNQSYQNQGNNNNQKFEDDSIPF